MSFSITNLKSRQNSLEILQKQIDSTASYGRQKDDRIWYPERDKSGKATAIIRFLPAPPQDGEDALPFARWWDHGFQGPTGKWYIEWSRTTMPGETDFVAETNNALWNSGNPAHQAIVRGDGGKVRGRKRNLHFISNILVVKDPQNPENNGKVFLFQYGKKIFDMIQEQAKPNNEEREKLGESPLEPCNVFDFWEGANFKFVITKKNNQTSYDSSTFEKPSPLFKSDDEIHKVYNSLYSLKEFIAPSKFKSAEELKAQFIRVVGPNDPGLILLGQTTVNTPTDAPASQKASGAKSQPSADIDTAASSKYEKYVSDDGPDEEE